MQLPPPLPTSLTPAGASGPYPTEVELTLDDENGHRHLAVTCAPHHTLAEVLEAAGVKTPGPRVWVDCRPVDSTTTIAASALATGAVISLHGPDRRLPVPVGTGLAVIAGLDAGTVLPLRPGTNLAGRGPGCDVVLGSPTVSPRHAHLDPAAGAVTDLGSPNGTAVDATWAGPTPTPVPDGAVIRLGAVATRLMLQRPPRVATVATGPGRPVDVHRGPRPARPAPPPPVHLPGRPDPPTPPAGPGVATLMLPAAFALVAAVLFSPFMAVFALLSPLMMLASWLDGRRRHRKALRRQEQNHQVELARAATELEAARAQMIEHRRAHPDIATAVTTCRFHTSLLWGRRPDHDDFLRLGVGLAGEPFAPQLLGSPAPDPDDAAALLTAVGRHLPPVPVVVDLHQGQVVAVTGPRSDARAVARAMVVEAVATHGPADVAIRVDTDDAPAWDWTRWLPHTEQPGSPVRVLTLVDRTGPAGRVTGPAIVVAADRVHLPENTGATVVLRDRFGRCDLWRADGSLHTDVLAAGVATETAEAAARALAPLRDPTAAAGSDLPRRVGLGHLIGGVTAIDLADRWRRATVASCPAVIGTCPDGPVTVDLAVDGPHALIAGTTGSGKSELLRSLIASIAAAAGPDTVTFVLVDYKGGAAFDACRHLPHVVGVITDLDGGLADRALASFEAEIRRREELLRRHGVSDLRACAGALPRLIIVCDEVATLVADQPDFVDALVDIAQRGRSLGVHLVLATQRPGGVVRDSIRANTDLTIALRTQDAHQSREIIGSDIAAGLPRDRPGRAALRIGSGPVTVFQAATVSDPAPAADDGVQVSPAGSGPADSAPAPAGPGRAEATDGRPFLDLLAAAATEAFVCTEGAPPHRPWLDPLPTEVSMDDIRRRVTSGEDAPGCTSPGTVPFGLRDDPARQTVDVFTWDPREGNLVVSGMRGSGTTTALVAVAAGLTALEPAPFIHVWTARPSELAHLAAWPQVSAVIDDPESVERLLDRLEALIAQRLHHPDQRLEILLLDGFTTDNGLADLGAIERTDRLRAVMEQGPAVGVVTVATATGPGSLPHALDRTAAKRLVLRLADPLDWAVYGLRPPTATMPPGRGVDAGTGLEVQVALPSGPLAGADTVPPPIRPLATVVDAVDLAPPSVEDGRLRLPIGEGTAGPLVLTVHPGQHVVVTGPPDSGRTTTLAVIGAQALAAGCPVVVPTATGTGADLLGLLQRFDQTQRASGLLRVCDRTEALDELFATDTGDPPDAGQPADVTGTPTIVLVDDADRVVDGNGRLQSLVNHPAPSVVVVASGRSETLRGAFGHWARDLLRHRVGVALDPGSDGAAELWQVRLPVSAALRRAPGRGLLISGGGPAVLQVARP